MKKAIIIIVSCFVSLFSWAQHDKGFFSETDPLMETMSRDSLRTPPEYVPHFRMAWKWMHHGVYRKFMPLDTLTDGVHNTNLIFKKSVSNTYLGNFPSPYESDIFMLREKGEDFYPLNTVREFLFKPVDALEYNTTTPFSQISYYNGGSQPKSEDWLEVWHLQNIRPFWSAGIRYTLISATGSYPYQKSKAYHFSLFSSYEKERVAISFFINQNTGHFRENGGIADPSEIRDTILNSQMLQTQLNYEPNNNYKNFNAYTLLQYNIGKGKETITIIDSLRQDTMLSYPMKVTLAARREENVHRFKEAQVETAFFPESYISEGANTDTYENNSWEINSKLIINEHPKYAYLPGIYAGVTHRQIDYKLRTGIELPLDTILNFEKRAYYGTYLTAGIFNVDTNALFNFDAHGELGVLGDYITDYSLQGEITQYFNRDRSSFFQASAHIKHKTPNDFLEFYLGNHDKWSNDFGKITSYQLQGSFHNVRRRTEIGIGVNNTTGYIYFDTLVAPRQYDADLLVFSAWIKQHFQWGHFHFDQKVFYQSSNKPEVLSLPILSLYSHNYFQGMLFKNVLTLQAGVDLFYNTAFYASAYRPSLMQFHNQRVEKTGNYPKLDVFLAFRLKRADVFVKAEHVSLYFANQNYFSALHYPINPFKVKYGVRWNFFD